MGMRSSFSVEQVEVLRIQLELKVAFKGIPHLKALEQPFRVYFWVTIHTICLLQRVQAHEFQLFSLEQGGFPSLIFLQ